MNEQNLVETKELKLNRFKLSLKELKFLAKLVASQIPFLFLVLLTFKVANHYGSRDNGFFMYGIIVGFDLAVIVWLSFKNAEVFKTRKL